MAVLAADQVQRLGHARQVNLLASKVKHIGPDQVVVQVHLTAVVRTHGRRQAGGVHIPKQYVKSRQCLAQQVAVFEVVPDQTVLAPGPLCHPVVEKGAAGNMRADDH